MSLEGVPQGAFRRPKVCRGWGKGMGTGMERGRLPGLPAPLSPGWNSGCLDSSSSGAFPRSYSLLTPRSSSLIGLIGKRLCPPRKNRKKKLKKGIKPKTHSRNQAHLAACPHLLLRKSLSRLCLASPFPFSMPSLPSLRLSSGLEAARRERGVGMLRGGSIPSWGEQ